MLKLWDFDTDNHVTLSRDRLFLSLPPAHILFRYLTFYAREDMRYKAKRSSEVKQSCFAPHPKGKASWPAFVVHSSQESDKYSSSI